MTAPQQENSPTTPTAGRYRVGQVVDFRHEVSLTGEVLEGHALVIRVPSDPEAAITLAPLSLFHLQVAPDAVRSVVKAGDVPTTSPQPEPDEASASS